MWRIGLGVGAAREKVRVARALGTLPKIDEALRKGEVSYSKVRAIVRIAKPEMEDRPLVYATETTGTQMEKICRSFRSVEQVTESGRPTRVDEEQRFVRRKHLPSGMVRIEAPLTADEADLVFRGLEAARQKSEERVLAGTDKTRIDREERAEKEDKPVPDPGTPEKMDDCSKPKPPHPECFKMRYADAIDGLLRKMDKLEIREPQARWAS
jgi:hypothetical protein